MARVDSTVTCPTCRREFQKRGAGAHMAACAERTGKPAPTSSTSAGEKAVKPAPSTQREGETHAEHLARIMREDGHDAVVLNDPEREAKEDTPPRPSGRPRFKAWKGGARE